VQARGALALVGRSASALLRIGADRLAEVGGVGLPRTPAQLAHPDVVNELLRAHAPDAGEALPPVESVRLAGVEFESSNCRNFLIDVEFGTPSRRPPKPPEPLPATLYAKMPCAELPTRVFGNSVGFWPLECSFCERVAHRVPIRVPRVYAAARRGSRFVLLLENLHERAGTRLFVNRDMAAGATLECARRCIETLAELHAAFWGFSREQREELLPTSLHPYLSPQLRPLTRALNSAAIGPARRAAPDVLDEELVRVCRLALEKWDALVSYWYREPLTLIHGDSHLGNCFEYPGTDGPRIGMIDFQGVQWCQGVRDLQYFLINSLTPTILERHESDLIDHYVAELARRGVALAGTDAREQYRALSFQTLMVGVVSLGLGSLTERESTVRIVLERGAAAVSRLGFGDWLRSL
jgi:hypothetical protein